MSEEKEKLVKVYSGTELSVNLLKDELAKEGIFSIIQNDFQSGIIAGFSGGGPTAVDLFIQEKNIEEAETVLQDFLARV